MEVDGKQGIRLVFPILTANSVNLILLVEYFLQNITACIFNFRKKGCFCHRISQVGLPNGKRDVVGYSWVATGCTTLLFHSFSLAEQVKKYDEINP